MAKRRRKSPPPDLPEELRKYWFGRYALFSRFDEGIKLNDQQWFSVTAELVAKRTAEEMKERFGLGNVKEYTVIDGFGGAGGNTIQFSSLFGKVYHVDNDIEASKLAANNLEVYEVGDNVEFLVQDFFTLEPTKDLEREKTVVFASPPWGGPEYNKSASWDIETSGDFPSSAIVDVARRFSDYVCLFLPRNSNLNDIAELVGSSQCSVVYMYLNQSCKGMCIYIDFSR